MFDDEVRRQLRAASEAINARWAEALREAVHVHVPPVVDSAESAALTRFAGDWEADGLWFLLSRLGVRQGRSLYGPSRPEVLVTVRDALCSLIENDDQFIAHLIAAIAEAPYLGPIQQHHLTHGLRHAAAGEWLDAEPPFFRTLEGAFWAAGEGVGLIDENQRPAAKPSASPIAGIEKLCKHMNDRLSEHFGEFLLGYLYRSAGNDARRGREIGAERSRVAFGVVALVGWLDVFAERRLLIPLASRLKIDHPSR